MKFALLVCALLVGCGSEQPRPVPPAPSNTGSASPTSSAGAKPEGAECLAAADCTSKVCEGEGCGADHPGHCVAADRMCTQDIQSYCGCDGKTFTASGSCPGQRYAHRNQCP